MMVIRRLRQVCKYGWKDALTISKNSDSHKGRLSCFIDMLYCFLKYNVWSNQYMKEKLYTLKGEEKKTICLKYQEKNTKRDQWVSAYFANHRFLYKWSNYKYETNVSLQDKRNRAYKKQYGLGENCFIGYDVKFHKHHFSEEKIITGAHCHFSEGTNIDFTGGLILGNGVALLEGVKILTHSHDYIGMKKEKDLLPNSKRAFLTPLEIADNATIGSQSIIMPGVRHIGENSIISAGSVVTKRVPDNVIVAGNPAKVIGSIEGMNIMKRSEIK